MEARIMKWKERVKTCVPLDIETIRMDAIKKEEERRCFEKANQFFEKMPARYKGKVFSDYQVIYAEQTKVKTILERFVATFPERLLQSTPLIFLGKPGTGKTLLSLILAQALAKNGFSVHYESSLKFLRMIQDKRYSSSAAFESALDLYKNTQFLILDEVTESITKDGCPSEYEKKMLFEIINARYEKTNLCTLIISNRDKKEVVKRLGTPIFDRLSENGLQLIFDWNSYR